MNKILIFVFIMACGSVHAQKIVGLNRVEFYLLKHPVADVSRSTSNIKELFKITLSDLEDTAFIKDQEIKLLTKTDTVRNIQSDQLMGERYVFTVSEAIVKRINDLKIPLCCGRQFAVVVNRNISYTGYFWNYFSSFGNNWITAFAHGHSIEILLKLPDYDLPHQVNDPRNEPSLIDCLKATQRYLKAK